MFRIVLLSLLSASAAVAQFSSAIQGTVTDASHAAVADAKVTVKNEATGIVRTTVTSGEGIYRVSSLGPGTYVVTVEKPGFSTKEERSVPVAVSEVARWTSR